MTRRQFLLRTAGSKAGFILPSIFDKVLAFVDQHDEPLLVKPSARQHVRDLLICLVSKCL